MKKKMKLSKLYYWVLSGMILFSIGSCKKDYNSTGYTPGAGAPVITSVSTLYRSVKDTAVTTVITYDASGTASTVVNTNTGHQTISALDSTTLTGKKQNLYVIHGSNLGSATSVMFNGTVAYFNRALGNDNTIVVSIPLAVPTTGAAATNKITVVTLHGTTTFGFTVLTPPPTLATISDFDFWNGSSITLTGVGFASVTAVGLSGSATTATIVSQTDDQLVIKFPASTVVRANLVFSYSSAGKTLTLTTKEEFNNLDNAFVIFGDDFAPNWQDASWSGPSGKSSAAVHAGTSSALVTYPAGGWKIEGWANWYPSFDYSPDYKFFTFWVKGGTVDHDLTLVGDQMAGGYGQNTSPVAAQVVHVPAKVWTFFKIPLGTPSSNDPTLLNFWKNGTPAKQLGFFLKGQGGDVDETMYFDEVAFLK